MSLADRTVLVTGADGFIGSHLTERLVADGARVRALCQYNVQGSWGWLDTVPEPVRTALDVRLGDIRDASFVDSLCESVEIVFHLAALISIPYSYVAAESYLDTNVRGSLNVFRSAIRSKCRRVVHTSTSEVYGTPRDLPIRESHPLHAQSPYAASKIAADQFATSFHLSFGLPVVVLRPFNTYGPRQSSRAILPTILTQLLGGATEVELGRLDPRRDLTYVTDTVDGFVRAATAPDVDGATIQLGTGVDVSIGELFDQCCTAVGTQARVRPAERRMRPGASEVQVLRSDSSLAAQMLGWQPTTSLHDGLKSTAEWMRHNLGRYHTERFHL